MLYFAYGSNLSKSAMRSRAPGTEPVSAAVLPEHALVFESNEPQGAPDAYFANVRPDTKQSVQGALYEINARDLAALDAYEDVSHGVYERVVLSVVRPDGTRADAVVYRMNVARRPRFGMPSPIQLEQIRAGYADWGLDLRVLEGVLDSIKPRIA